MDLVRYNVKMVFCSCSFLYYSPGDYLRYAQKHTDSFAHNRRLWKYCKGGKNNNCYKPWMLNRFCSMFPFQSMKTVRLRANFSRELLEDDRLVATFLRKLERYNFSQYFGQFECSGAVIGTRPKRDTPVKKTQRMVSKASRLRQSNDVVPRPR